MNIVRKIHDQFRVKSLAGSTLQSPTSTSDSTGSGNTYITITGGSLGGGGLSEAYRSKLNSIEQGAQVNQDAFSKVLLETTNREQEQQTTTSSSIIANIPSDTANIRLVGNYPIKVSLESVSLFNYNTVTTTGDIVASYNVQYNEDGNIVIDYVSGTLFSTTDIEIIRIQHREETLATYNNTQFEYTESEGTITQFIIPYQGTDFSSIQFCRYETSSSESTEGTETVRELSVITELPVSPTKQQIITLSDTNANYWKYEEDENGNRYLWTDCNVYSTKEVSAYGKAEGQEMPTILNLSQLQDVALTNLSNNQVLVYNASSQKWVNIDANNLGISADNLKTLTITVNGTSYTYNPASSNQSISITTITLDDVLPYINNKLDREEFFKWFTINYDSNNNVTSIQANYDFYSIKGISAYGLGDISGITRTTLQSLDDVSLSNLVADNMLAYNGSKWVNIPMSQVRGATSWADLENKPTTISGFGITDAYTKTEVNTKISEVSSKVTELSSSKADATIQVIAGDGLTGGGNLQQDITIALQNLNSAGTYTKVTVDTYGRVTSGSTLLATDIPNLDWSKITSGKPTTLEGYGITDGVNSITFTGSGNAITAVTISNHLLTFTKGETFLPKSTFDDLFEKVNVGTTDSPVYAIKAKYHLYSVGEVSAYEFGETGGIGVTSLEELIDVQLTNIVADSILKYNGSKWVNVPITEVKGATSWDEIEDKPSAFTPRAHTHTVADITDISPLVLNVNGSSLFTYNGKSSVTANLTVPTKVSQLTNDSGYLTAITKAQVEGVLTGNITSHTHDFASLTSKPTTISGYGITDAITTNNIGSQSVSYATSASNADTVDNEHASAFAHIGAHNNLMASSNEFTFASSGFSGIVYINYQTAGGSNGNITEYRLCNGAGRALGTAIHTGNYNSYTPTLTGAGASGTWGISITGKAATATKSEYSRNLLGRSTSGSNYEPSNNNFIFAEWSTKSDGRWYLKGNGYECRVDYATSAGNADTVDGYHASSFLLRGRMTNPSSGTSYHGAIPFPISLKSAGFPVYNDPEFANGNNSIYVYNNLENGTVTISRIADNQGSANSSGYILQISTTSGEASPGRGGFHQYIQSRQNAVFAQIFRAKIPVGFSVVNAENGMGNGYTTFWLTDTAGTGKWEWYIRITICGSGGNYSSGGHVYLSGSGAVTWYLAYCNVIDLTKGNYDGLRTVCTDKLQTARTLWGQSFDGTANVNGSLSNTGTIRASAAATYDIGSNSLDYRYGYFQWIGAKSNTNLRLAANNSDNQIVLHINGNVGIGITTPAHKLDVNGNIRSNQSIIGYRYSTNSNAAAFVWDKPGSYYTGVGSDGTADTIRFSACNDDGTWVSYTQNWKFYGNIAATGEVTAKASSSDMRLKTDISDYKALSIIRSHKSIKYHWNEVAKANADVFNDDYWHYGLIAQDVQRDMPQMVSDVFKDYLTVKYERLIPICWKGLQEVDDEVTKLKKRVKQLEKRLQKYESTEVFYIKGND